MVANVIARAGEKAATRRCRQVRINELNQFFPQRQTDRDVAVIVQRKTVRRRSFAHAVWVRLSHLQHGLDAALVEPGVDGIVRAPHPQPRLVGRAAVGHAARRLCCTPLRLVRPQRHRVRRVRRERDEVARARCAAQRERPTLGSCREKLGHRGQTREETL
eukprot:6211092-Pleurochrysis_carterae.AAC.2